MQVSALYENCLKLATENKITSRNTWELPLIDHISDLVAGDKVGRIFCKAQHPPSIICLDAPQEVRLPRAQLPCSTLPSDHFTASL